MTCFRTLVRLLLLPALWFGALEISSAQSWQSAQAIPNMAGEESAITDIIQDGVGGYVVTGYFTGTLRLGGVTLSSAGSADVFVARLSVAGTWGQVVQAGGTLDEYPAGLALSPTGTIIVAGTFSSPTMTFGTHILRNGGTSGLGSGDIFIGTYNLNGQWTQALQGGSPHSDQVTGVAVDATGTVVIAGTFSDGITVFGSNIIRQSSTLPTLFVARLSSAGRWTQAITATSFNNADYIADLALDANGNAVVAGYLSGGGSLTLGSTTLTAPTYDLPFVARLSAAGSWTQAVAATACQGISRSTALALDANGNVALVGNFQGGNLTFGTTSLAYHSPSSVSGNTNLFVAVLNSAGVWTRAAGATACLDGYASDVAFEGSGNIVVAGVFDESSITFGSTTLTNAALNSSGSGSNFGDLFLARLNPAGSWDLAAQAGGPDFETAAALLLDANGALVVGLISGPLITFGPYTLSTPAITAGFVARLGGLLPTRPSLTQTSLTLTPNPAHGTVSLTMPALAIDCPVLLLDALGREVLRLTVPAHPAAPVTATLDLSGLPAGLYLVRGNGVSARLVVE